MKVIGIVEDNFYFVQKTPKKIAVEFRVGNHTISLENFEYYERMSEETNAFSADLVLDGEKVGDCSNDGRGGCANYSAHKNWDLAREIATAVSEVEDYCFPERKLTLEDVIDQLASFMVFLQDNKVTTITKAKAVVKYLNEQAVKYRKMYS
jgi:hypothetical protein